MVKKSTTHPPSPQPETRHREKVEWRARAATLFVGFALSVVLLYVFYGVRQRGEDLALGRATESVPAFFQDVRINAWRLPEYPSVYPSEADVPARGEALWLGNSQLHAINQAQPGDTTAPAYASRVLSQRVYGLSLPNAGLQEHLAIFQWARDQRDFEWLIIGVVYDDLREDSIREEFTAINNADLIARLSESDSGQDVAKQLLALGEVQGDIQGTTRSGQSLQDASEQALNHLLDNTWDVWQARPDIYTAVLTRLYFFRNWFFNIQPTSKREIIPLRSKKNMAALKEILDGAHEAGIETVVYIAPLRWDIEPPYHLDRYRAWKQEMRELTVQTNAHFLDLDKLVPSEHWGLLEGELIDFMHFQNEGHRLLGEEIAGFIRQTRESDGEVD